MTTLANKAILYLFGFLTTCIETPQAPYQTICIRRAALQAYRYSITAHVQITRYQHGRA